MRLIIFETPLCPSHLQNLREDPRAEARGSSSSEKITHGRADLTFSKMSLIFFSDSPTYMFISSGPFTLRKFNEHSVATAFACNVQKFKAKHPSEHVLCCCWIQLTFEKNRNEISIQTKYKTRRSNVYRTSEPFHKLGARTNSYV